jgi:hypothetical protein
MVNSDKKYIYIFKYVGGLNNVLFRKVNLPSLYSETMRSKDLSEIASHQSFDATFERKVIEGNSLRCVSFTLN